MNHDGDERTRADRVNAFVGSPVERVEDLRFLRGRGQYVDDVPAASVLHAAVLRSSVAHGRVRRIDAGRARALPGVHAVITAAEIGPEDRKSTRLNSSHQIISYAVFCLKKKNAESLPAHRSSGPTQ